MEAELRDQFAMAALTEAMDMEGSASGRWTEWCANVADMAYDIADAMMEERKRRELEEYKTYSPNDIVVLK